MNNEFPRPFSLLFNVPSQDSFIYLFISILNRSLDLYRIKKMMFGMKQLQLFADIVFQVSLQLFML